MQPRRWCPAQRSTLSDMAKKKTKGKRAGGGPANDKHKDSARDVIESVVIAFILAFLFRTFEAEAFVIPTGSMAPTLMGRHKDMPDSQSGCWYHVGASDEVNNGQADPRKEVWSATSPLNHHTMPVGQENSRETYYSYSGDRILVSKVAYLFQDPQRWDVIVFKFPHGAQQNYIKRLIGLPEEEIKIVRGDIYVRPFDEQEFAIARKPPEKMQAMLQIVHDNDYQVAALEKAGWPARWKASEAGPWKASADGRSFAIEEPTGTVGWLRYQHVFPSYDAWAAIEAGRQPPEPVQRLIVDFCQYNTGQPQAFHDGVLFPPPLPAAGVQWVGDLAMQCELKVTPQDGTPAATLELVKGGRRFQCRFDYQTGKASLWLVDADARKLGESQAGVISLGKSHALMFSNIDAQLRLSVDGRWIEFEGDGLYTPDPERYPKDSDLEPAGISVTGAKADVSHLRLWRDIYYYTNPNSDTDFLPANLPNIPPAPAPSDLDDLYARARIEAYKQHHPLWVEYWNHFQAGDQVWQRYAETQDVISDELKELHWKAYAEPPPSDLYRMEKDQFFVLGDNSQKSYDGRFWPYYEHYVRRDLLIGKAIFIYWPHGWETPIHKELPFSFFGGEPLRVPFYPNFRRMNFIR